MFRALRLKKGDILRLLNVFNSPDHSLLSGFSFINKTNGRVFNVSEKPSAARHKNR